MKMRIFFPFLMVFLAMFFIVACEDEKETNPELERMEKFLKDNNIKVSPTASGLYFVEQEAGTGVRLESGDHGIMEYTARLVTRRVVESTDENLSQMNKVYNPDLVYGPRKFKLDNLPVPGLIEGLQLMSEGGSALMVVPPDIAYGQNAPGVIPPNAALVYEVRLIKVIKDAAAHEAGAFAAYIADNNITVSPTASGLYFVEEEEGTGFHPEPDATVVVHYRGSFLDGRVFVSTYESSPVIVSMGSGEMPAGFEEGIQKMKPQGKATLIMPSSLAYGAEGSENGRVFPYMPLIYEVDLLEDFGGIVDSVAFMYNGEMVTYGTVLYGGMLWLDRNLGASRVATHVADAQGFGDLFQWGRADDGHQVRNSSVVLTLAPAGQQPGHGNYIRLSADPYDWNEDNSWVTRWSDENGRTTEADPCPPGWRVPTINHWQTAIAAGGWSSAGEAYDSPLKLVIAGQRSHDGTLRNFDLGEYHTSSWMDPFLSSGRLHSYRMRLHNVQNYVIIDNTIMNVGMSVRCVRDN